MKPKFKVGQSVSAVVKGHEELGEIVGEVKSITTHNNYPWPGIDHFYTVEFDMIPESQKIHENDLRSPIEGFKTILYAFIIGIILLSLIENLK